MRRLAVSIFLLFYTVSVVGLTLHRTEQWAAERALSHRHLPVTQPTHNRAQVAEPHKHSVHADQTKLNEDFQELSSFVLTISPPHFETKLPDKLVEFVANRNPNTLSSRAPPSSL